MMQISVFQLLETGNKYLLEKIIDLFLVFREEVADCIYSLAVLLDHFSKSTFSIVHQSFLF